MNHLKRLLKTIFHSEKQISYYECLREIELNRDKMKQEFEKRSREWNEHRRQIDETARWSMHCSRLVSDLHMNGLIKYEIFHDYFISDEWTAHLPVEIGEILKKARNDNDGNLIHLILRT